MPGLASVLRVEHADRGYADPKTTRVDRIGNDGMQDEADAARLPLRTRGVSAQTLHLSEALAAVVADEKSRRFDADIEPPVRGVRDPSALNRGLALRVRQPLARMRPRRAAIVRFPYCWTEPGVSARRVDRLLGGISGDMGQRPMFAVGSSHAPVAPRAVAFEKECALLGANQHRDAHDRHSLWE